MSNETISVPRELLERVAAQADYMLGFTSASNYDECRKAVDELCALLAKPAEHVHEWDINAEGTATVCHCGSRSSDEPTEQPRGEPVAVVGTVPGTGFKSLDFAVDLQQLTEGTKLYTRPAERPEPIGSTSDKYKAELYDEVWQLARDMGFGNVTDALMKLNKQTAPVAVVLPERIDESICRGHSLTLAIKWNRCLDEVARLNPPQQ